MSREMQHSGIEWIGEIPKDWKIMPFKQMYELGKGLSITKADLVEEGIPVISYGQIHSKANTGTALKDELIRYVPDALLENNTSSLVKKGDMIFADTSEDLDGCGNCVYIDRDITIFAGYHTIIAKYQSSTPNNYLSYLFKTDCWRSQIRSSVNGVKLFSVPQKLLGSTTIILPPLSEQQKIANYLDKVCGEVDEMIALQEQMIKELKAYKQSVITEAITKGLNPDVPMKDSGIDWIGEVPEHWEVRRIGNLFKLRDEKNYKPMDEVQLLSLYTGIGVFPHGEQEERGNKAITVEGYKVVHKNDIVVNIILAWMGAIGVSNYDGVTSPAYDVYIPGLSKVVPHFFHYVFRTQGIAGECYKYGRGIMMMRWRTYSSEFKQIRVPFPSMEEQQSIADFLDNKCAEIDALIAVKQAKIDELKDYKKSVIYEYVTGKKEVV